MQIAIDNQSYDLNNLPKHNIVNSDVELSNLGLTQLLDLKQWVAKGDFHCCLNYGLSDLINCPENIVGDIICGQIFDCVRCSQIGGAKFPGGAFRRRTSK